MARLCCNSFTAMPKGTFTMTIEDKSSILKIGDTSTFNHKVLAKVDGLVLRVSKKVSKDGDLLTYRLSERELSKKQVLDFDASFFDDAIKI